MADQAPLNQRISEIQRIIRLTPSDDRHAARLLVQLAQSMLSEEELNALPEVERVRLYKGMEATIARLKPAVARLNPSGGEGFDLAQD